MGLIGSVKTKIATIFAQNLSKKIEAGDFGAVPKRVWLAMKGKKTVLGAALFMITMAVGEFGPPWAPEYTQYLGMATGALSAIGFLDKAWRKEPIFEPWLLEGIAKVSGWLAAASAAILSVSSSGVLDLALPGHPGLADQINVFASALTSVTLFLNRVTAANAAAPQ